MTAEFDLVVLGDVNPDLVLRGGDVVPAFAQAERLVDEARLTIGGSGAIMACAAVSLGLRVALCGVVGADHFGDWMRERLAAKGVDTRGLHVADERPTGITVVLSTAEDRAMLTMPGTVADLRRGLIDLDLLRAASHVHVSSYFMQRSLAPDLSDLLGVAHEAGATTSLDPNWDPSGAWDGGLNELLRSVDVFLPNEMEALRIARISELTMALERLHALGPLVVVKRGPDGAVAFGAGGEVRAEGVPTEVVDTTGAGDAFDAGFVAGHLAGQPLERSLALANACGALSTRAVGGTDGLPSMDDVLAAIAAGSAA
jgi:sugar/nucleoside kinase (ribokinase family)